MPLISIITVTYNAEKFLERTLKSFEKQSFQDFELLLIDGASTDGTLTIAEKYKPVITKIISEPDRGIYDAMNKGLRMASGDFVWFINAGDEIAESNTLERIINHCKEETDLIYGDSLFVDNSGQIRGKRSQLTPHRLYSGITWKDLKYGMLVSHQSLLVKKQLAPDYDISNLSADVDWEINCFKRAKHPLFLDFPLSRFLEGGVSNQQLKRSLKDRYRVLRKHFGFLPNIINHIFILHRGIKLVLKKGGKYW